MRATWLTTTAMLLCLPMTAVGQTASEAAPGASEQAAEGQAAPSEGLGDIVVTAQRKSENLQRAAVAVDVVSGSDLISAGITQVDRLSEQVPALTVEPTSTGNLIFIRGVGNFTVTPNSDPAIAFNYDGVYVGRPAGTTGVFFDLERVEVLKGPQGTLYGRNATGGAINVIPVQPKLGDLSGYATANFGNYKTITGEGAINVPLGDNGAFRLSASHSSHDGYLRDGGSDENLSSLRAQLKAELTPNLTVRVATDYSHTGGDGASVSYIGNYVFSPAAGANVFIPANLDLDEGVLSAASQAYRLTVPTGPAGRRLDALAISPFQDNNFYGANAQIDLKTSFGTITVTPAWRNNDLNYLSTAGAFAYRQREEDNQYSIEARLTGDRIGIFDYTLGLYYYHETIDSRTALSASATTTFQNSRLGTKSYAPFGRVTAHLSDRLRLVGGVRYTEDHKTYLSVAVAGTIACQVRINNVPTCPTAPLFPLVEDPSLIPFAFPAPGGAPRPLIVNGVPSGAIVIRSDRSDDTRLKNTKVTYRGAVEFDVADQSLAFASIETGYRSGGFSPATGFETYQPETITAYTLGVKNRFFDNRLQLNVEAFWWEYRNQQVSAVRPDLSVPPRTANITQNIGRSRIRGVEIEGRFLLTPRTLISTNIQYLDAQNGDFRYIAQNAGTPPVSGCATTLSTVTNSYTVDCSAFPSYNSPKWTLNFSAQHTVELGDYQVVLGADTQHKTSFFGGFLYLPQQKVEPAWRSNAQISFGPADERWSVSGYVRNIEGDRVPAYLSTHPLANIVIAGTTAPRTYGVRAAVRF